MKNCFSSDTFDVDKMKEASKLFLGWRDFRSFMGKGTHHADKITRRTVDRLDVVETSPLLYSPYSWPSCMSFDKSDYQFLDIYMKADGFLYRQVSALMLLLFSLGVYILWNVLFLLRL